MDGDLGSNLLLGLSVAASPVNLLYCFIGALIGTVIGVLPGIGPVATISILLPITFSLSPVASLIMIAGIYYGAQYGGSTTAILVNLPGEASSAVSALDGYQMARKGRAGAALTAAALGSVFAGSVSTLAIAMFAAPLTQVALSFGPAEYFSLMVLGLVSSVALASGSILKALAVIVLGLLFGCVGTDMHRGVTRFAFGSIELADGINFVALSIGLFGVAEILRNLQDEHSARVLLNKVTSLWPTREEVRRMIAPVLRGTAIGSVLGVLPGGGALLSSFAAYMFEKRVSPHSKEFGHGAIEGVAAPESANNAGAQTSFIPMLTLGIPSNPVMALMGGAMILQGIVPGPTVVTEKPDLFWGLIASMWIGNIMLLILNLPLVGLWVRLLSVPYNVLFPAIIGFCVVGVYTVNTSEFEVYEAALLGVLGFIFLRLRCEVAPLVLGFILGPMLEENLRRAMIVSRGDPMVFLERPISAGLLLAALVVLCVVSIPAIKRKRSEVFVDE